jgi:hypothetical protein
MLLAMVINTLGALLLMLPLTLSRRRARAR